MNAAVIGVGNMGKHHVRNYFEIPETNLVAIADTNPEIGKALASEYKCQYYEDYQEMLEKESIEMVTIAVPTKYHKKVALDCIEKGIHVLIEKPIAANVAEAREIVQKAKEKGIKFTVGHIERFNPAVLKLKEMVDKGELGEITSIVTRRIGPMPTQIKDANVVIDIGVHDIDLMNWFFGKLPDKISAGGGNALNKTRQDYVDIFLKYGKMSGLAQANWITPVKIRTMAVSGTKAYIELNFITQELAVFESLYTTEYDDFGEFVIKFGEPKEKNVIKVDPIEPLKAEIKAFAEAITNDTRPLVTAQEAIEALAIACKVDHLIRK